MKTPIQLHREAAAERYARAEPSDPFLWDRIRTHMANGVAGFGADGVDAFYSAIEGSEERSFQRDGEIVTYQAVTYSNRQRP